MKNNDQFKGQGPNDFPFDEFESDQPEVSPDRLFEATEAVLAAVDEMITLRGNCPYPPDLMGTEEQPERLDDFTRYEVAEATAFLVRLGVLRARIKHQPESDPAD